MIYSAALRLRTEPSTALRPPRWISLARCWKRRGLYPDAFGLTGCIWYNRRSILLHRPQSNFEFDGVVLSWFRFCLTGRQWIVVVRSFRSALRLLSVVYPRVLCWGLFCSFCTWCQTIKFSPVILLATTLFLTTHNPTGHVHLTLFRVLFAKWRNV